MIVLAAIFIGILTAAAGAFMPLVAQRPGGAEPAIRRYPDEEAEAAVTRFKGQALKTD